MTKKASDLGCCPNCGRKLTIYYNSGFDGTDVLELLGIHCPVAITWCRGYTVPIADMKRRPRELALALHEKFLTDQSRDHNDRPVGHPSEHIPNHYSGPGIGGANPCG